VFILVHDFTPPLNYFCVEVLPVDEELVPDPVDVDGTEELAGAWIFVVFVVPLPLSHLQPPNRSNNTTMTSMTTPITAPIPGPLSTLSTTTSPLSFSDIYPPFTLCNLIIFSVK
jgi:hypothetical protein